MTGFRPRTVGPQHYRHFLLSFMPGELRKLRPTGIHIFGCRYWADWLGPEIADGRGRIAVRYDTRDISRIYAQAATGEWLSIHLFSPREAFSLHEHNAIKRKLRIDGRATSDEEVIHQARLEQREIEEQASARTKAARRARERHQRGYESSAAWLGSELAMAGQGAPLTETAPEGRGPVRTPSPVSPLQLPPDEVEIW